MLEIPESFGSIEDDDERQGVLAKVKKSIVQQAYLQEILKEEPVLGDIWTADQGATINHLMGFSANSWKSGLSPFRQCLIRLWKNWE